MNRLFASFLAGGICLTPVTVTLIPQSSLAQTQVDEVQLLQLLQQAVQQTQQGQPQQAIETLRRFYYSRNYSPTVSEAIAL